MAMPKRVPVEFHPDYDLTVQQPVVDPYHAGMAHLPKSNWAAGLQRLSRVFNSLAAQGAARENALQKAQGEFEKEQTTLGISEFESGREVPEEASIPFQIGFYDARGKSARRVFESDLKNRLGSLVEGGSTDETAFAAEWDLAKKHSEENYPLESQWGFDAFNNKLPEFHQKAEADFLAKIGTNKRNEIVSISADYAGSTLLEFEQSGREEENYKNTPAETQQEFLEGSLLIADNAGLIPDFLLSADGTSLNLETPDDFETAWGIYTAVRSEKARNRFNEILEDGFKMGPKTYEKVKDEVIKTLIDQAKRDGGESFNRWGADIKVGEHLFSGTSAFRDAWQEAEPTIDRKRLDLYIEQYDLQFHRRYDDALEAPPFNADVKNPTTGRNHWEEWEYLVRNHPVYSTKEFAKERGDRIRDIDKARRAFTKNKEKSINVKSLVSTFTAGVADAPPDHVSIPMEQWLYRHGDGGVTKTEFMAELQENVLYGMFPPIEISATHQFNPYAPLQGPWADAEKDRAFQIAEWTAKANVELPYVQSTLSDAAYKMLLDQSDTISFEDPDITRAFVLYQAYAGIGRTDLLFSESSEHGKIFQEITRRMGYEDKSLPAVISDMQINQLPLEVRKRDIRSTEYGTREGLRDAAKELSWHDYLMPEWAGGERSPDIGDRGSEDLTETILSVALGDRANYWYQAGFSALVSKDKAVEYFEENWTNFNGIPIALPPLKPNDPYRRGEFATQKDTLIEGLQDYVKSWSKTFPQRFPYVEGQKKDDWENVSLMSTGIPGQTPLYELIDGSQWPPRKLEFAATHEINGKPFQTEWTMGELLDTFGTAKKFKQAMQKVNKK